MTKHAMSCGYCSKAARIAASVSCSRATTSVPGDRYGDGTRGQANCGKRAVLTGSVLVRLSV